MQWCTVNYVFELNAIVQNLKLIIGVINDNYIIYVIF